MFAKHIGGGVDSYSIHTKRGGVEENDSSGLFFNIIYYGIPVFLRRVSQPGMIVHLFESRIEFVHSEPGMIVPLLSQELNL